MFKIILNFYYTPVDKLKHIISENKDIYVPVNGGSSLKNDEWCRNNVYFDDGCENHISDHNAKLNEMTSIWWFWKRMSDFGNPDYIGFNHYRRFFDLAYLKRGLDKAIYVAKPIKCPYSLEWQYGVYHNIDDLEICYKTLADTADGFTAVGFHNYMMTKHDNFAPCNMFVMKRELFEQWLEFVFPVLFKLEERIDVSGRDNYQKRAICFLCERLFGFWSWLRCQELPYEELDIIEHLDFKDNKLNERGTY